MLEDILNPRRAPRLSIRCAVELRHRLAVWSGDTEDLAPGGCQIVTRRVVDPGTDVKLAIRCDAISRTILAAGRVVWMRAGAPSRLGVAFAPGAATGDWFEALVRASPGRAGAAPAVPARLPRATRIRLGKAPEGTVDLTQAELDVLRRVGAGVTLDELAASFGTELGERTRGALFALLARRCLVLDGAGPSSAAGWERALARAGDAPPAPARRTERSLGASRTPEAQRLYDEALTHIGGGRLALAMDRLQDALRHAPDDPLIASTAKRISRWA